MGFRLVIGDPHLPLSGKQKAFESSKKNSNLLSVFAFNMIEFRPRVLCKGYYPNAATAHQALDRAVQKLPIKARVISREEAI